MRQGGSVPGLPVTPAREEFLEMAREFTIVPVHTCLLADSMRPVASFQALVGAGQGFLFESFEQAGRWSRYSYLGRAPILRLVKERDGRVTCSPLPSWVQEGDLSVGFLKALKAVMAGLSSPPSELPPLHSGLVGYLGYELVREIERLPDLGKPSLEVPDAAVEVVGELVAFDHFKDQVYVVSNVLTAGRGEGELEAAYDEAVATVNEMVARLQQVPDRVPWRLPLEARRRIERMSGPPEARYKDAVSKARRYILDGDIFQVVLSERMDFPMAVDAFSVYRALRHINPSPYLFFIRRPEVTIVGSSPESLVKVRGERVISRPIAGTRKRGNTPEEDRELEVELLSDRKERAEHVMLVDLARNDLGRVCEYGSVQVDELMVVERYSHVMHMTSEVSGRLRRGQDLIDVLSATFPAGTLSGAPKVRAMEIIEELEPVRRGVYGGVVGYIDASRNMDTAITIRTLVVTNDGTGHLQVGAGIVADSNPDLEYKEIMNKAEAVLAAVERAQDQ
jgi:anthranilate synthase component 1